MGLMDLFRKKPDAGQAKTPSTPTPAAAPTAAPVTPAVVPPPATSPVETPDFDALLAAMKAGEPKAQERYWQAFFRLPSLCFHCSGVSQDDVFNHPGRMPPPFIEAREDGPMLHVFTDSRRAGEFGAKNAQAHIAAGRPAPEFLTLTLDRDTALQHFLSLPSSVSRLLINVSFFGARQNIPWLYALSVNPPVSLTEACSRLKIEPWGPLSAKAEATELPEDQAELVRAFLQLPQWFTVTEKGRRVPTSVQMADGASFLLLFTSEAEAAKHKLTSKDPLDVEPLAAEPAAFLNLLLKAKGEGTLGALVAYNGGHFGMNTDLAVAIAHHIGLGQNHKA